MNSKTALLALTALALVTGCNRGGANNSASAGANNSSTSANTSAAPAAAATAGGEAVDAAFLTANSWAPEGQCEDALKFNADGTAESPDHRGGWSLSGQTLTMTKEGDPDQQMTVTRSGDNLVMNPGGIVAMPCPADAGGTNEAG